MGFPKQYKEIILYVKQEKTGNLLKAACAANVAMGNIRVGYYCVTMTSFV